MLEALTITITRHGRAPFGYMEGRDTNGVKDKFSDVSLRSVSQQDCLAEMIIFGFRLADVSA
jgi:hypothetical protein